MTIAALEAGKHVICTVPMATSVEECRQICQLVKETGLKYMMAETVVYSREFLYIKQLYDSGELGKIQFLQAHRTWRAGPPTGNGSSLCSTPLTLSVLFLA